MRRNYVNSAFCERESQCFDEVYDLEKLEDGLKGWKCYEYNDDEGMKKVGIRVTVGVIGDDNVGKTFFLGKVSKCKLPHKFNIQTRGISVKRTDLNKWIPQEEGRYRVIAEYLDFSEVYTPLPNLDNENGENEILMNRDEIFHFRLILSLVDSFIIVVSHMSLKEQTLINTIKRECRNNTTICIVHNLRDVRKFTDLEGRIKKQCTDLFEGNLSIIPSYEPSYCDRFKSFLGGANNYPQYYSEDYMEEQGVKVLHYFLGEEGTDGGRFNKYVYRELRDIYLRANTGRRKKPMIDRIREQLNRLIVDNIQNVNTKIRDKNTTKPKDLKIPGKIRNYVKKMKEIKLRLLPPAGEIKWRNIPKVRFGGVGDRRFLVPHDVTYEFVRKSSFNKDDDDDDDKEEEEEEEEEGEKEEEGEETFIKCFTVTFNAPNCLSPIYVDDPRNMDGLENQEVIRTKDPRTTNNQELNFSQKDGDLKGRIVCWYHISPNRKLWVKFYRYTLSNVEYSYQGRGDGACISKNVFDIDNAFSPYYCVIANESLRGGVIKFHFAPNQDNIRAKVSNTTRKNRIKEEEEEEEDDDVDDEEEEKKNRKRKRKRKRKGKDQSSPQVNKFTNRIIAAPPPPPPPPSSINTSIPPPPPRRRRQHMSVSFLSVNNGGGNMTPIILITPDGGKIEVYLEDLCEKSVFFQFLLKPNAALGKEARESKKVKIDEGMSFFSLVCYLGILYRQNSIVSQTRRRLSLRELVSIVMLCDRHEESGTQQRFISMIAEWSKNKDEKEIEVAIMVLGSMFEVISEKILDQIARDIGSATSIVHTKINKFILESIQYYKKLQGNDSAAFSNGLGNVNKRKRDGGDDDKTGRRKKKRKSGN